MTEKNRIDDLEKRVDALRKEAHDLKIIIQKLKKESVEDQQLVSEALPTVKEMTVVTKKPKVVIKEQVPVDWEKQIGQVWLPRIFIFVLLLGVIWAFKAASDYGIINAPVKVGLGYISAAVLQYIGQRQINKSRNALGQVMIGGSVVLLLIVTFAMHVLYDMVPTIPALLLNILWIGLGVYLANVYKSEPLAVLTGVGGYLIPFLLESKDPNVINLLVFETIFYLVLLLFALKKKFTILYHVSFVLLHITLLAALIITAPIESKIFGLAVIIQHIVLLTTFFVRQDILKQQMGVLFTSFILTMAWVGLTFPENQYEMVVLFAFAVYSFLSIAFWNKGNVRLSTTLSISTMALLVFLVSKFEVENVLGLLILQGLISIYLGILASSRLKQIVGTIIYIISVSVTISIGFERISSIEFFNWLILLGSIVVLIKLLPAVDVFNKENLKKLIQIIYVSTFLLLLVFITLTVQALTQAFTLNIQYMSVSIAWSAYALVGIFLGSTRDNKPLRVFGLVLMFVTLAKLVFIDLSYISLLIRAILFMALGIIGVIGSRILYKVEQK